MVSRVIGLIVTLTFALSPALASAQVTPPAVPANLEPSSGQPFLIAGAEGTQNYICVVTNSGFAWTFFGPQATLFNGAAQQVITHYLSANPIEGGTPRPTWLDSIDSSAIWAMPVASSTDPAFVAPGAIPWLLLRIVGAESGPTGGTTLTNTIFIQRVNTAGGAAPATGCKSVKDVGRKALVPYTTDYVFYK